MRSIISALRSLLTAGKSRRLEEYSFDELVDALYARADKDNFPLVLFAYPTESKLLWVVSGKEHMVGLTIVSGMHRIKTHLPAVDAIVKEYTPGS